METSRKIDLQYSPCEKCEKPYRWKSKAGRFYCDDHKPNGSIHVKSLETLRDENLDAYNPKDYFFKVYRRGRWEDVEKRNYICLSLALRRADELSEEYKDQVEAFAVETEPAAPQDGK